MNLVLKDTISNLFTERFGLKPLLFFSPGRINLIGEHTDYNNGFVFPAAIDKGIYAAIEVSETEETQLLAFDLHEEFTLDLNKVKPLAIGSWQNYLLGVVSEIQKRGRTLKNFNFVFGGDIPNGAGLSSSAALENALVFGLNTLFELGFRKEEMIAISQKAEHHFVGVQCGIMDQYASMFGQAETAILLDCLDLSSTPFKINFKDYELLLINSNVKHSLSESAYNERRKVCEEISDLLGVESLRAVEESDLLACKNQLSEDSYQKGLYILQENKRVLHAGKVIESEDLKTLGKLLYESHAGLRFQYQVSCKELDFLVDATLDNEEILGARMMGGGFGGCTINIILKSAIASFSKKIQAAFYQEFKTACSIYKVSISQGTHLLKNE
uniref:galactokinase n=1 Tax=Polaribacter sp. TaxID=1920175 RepID=UPI004048B6A2